MYIMTINYYAGHGQDFLYVDADAECAKANYEKLRVAMTEYQRFKNDTAESISLESSTGLSVFRIEHIVSVSLCNEKEFESVQREYAEMQGKLMAARDIAKARASWAATNLAAELMMTGP